MAISFCDAAEFADLKNINKLIGLKIPSEKHPFESEIPKVASQATSPKKPMPKRNGFSGQRMHQGVKRSS